MKNRKQRLLPCKVGGGEWRGEGGSEGGAVGGGLSCAFKQFDMCIAAGLT